MERGGGWKAGVKIGVSEGEGVGGDEGGGLRVKETVKQRAKQEGRRPYTPTITGPSREVCGALGPHEGVGGAIVCRGACKSPEKSATHRSQ